MTDNNSYCFRLFNYKGILMKLFEKISALGLKLFPQQNQAEYLTNHIVNDNLKAIELFLDAGANPNSPVNAEGDTPISVALTKGDAYILRLLMKYGGKLPDVNDEMLETSWLGVGLNQNNLGKFVEWVKVLSDLGFFKRQSPEVVLRMMKYCTERILNDGNQAVLYAYQNVQKAFKWMIQDVSFQNTDKKAKQINRYFVDFVLKNHMSYLIDEMVRRGLDMNIKDSSGMPLIMGLLQPEYDACDEDIQHKALKKLLKYPQIDLNAQDKSGNTLLHFLAAQDEDGILKAVLEQGANPNIQNTEGHIPLVSAARWGSRACVEQLLNVDPDLKQVNEALMHAVHGSRFEVVELLVEKGNADVNYGDVTRLGFALSNDNEECTKDYCETPLMNAHTSQIAEYLIQKGANVNAQDLQGYTPLMHVIDDCKGMRMSDVVDIVYLLVKKGANVNAQVGGETPLIAVSKKCDRIENKLIFNMLVRQSNIDLNAQDKRGKTALMYCVETDNEKGVHALCQAGARMDIRDNTGKTALQLAAENTHDSKVYDVLYRYMKAYCMSKQVEKATRKNEPVCVVNGAEKGVSPQKQLHTMV